ncbi:conserved hypothetical protein [Ricinus communis]|uniref:Uncharacterized protein n=1 Tax=Ricinus communis TaxID=3988 RepID=B9T5I7_RICCO|nr:conserved hypothetical protein [Ricinus communis]
MHSKLERTLIVNSKVNSRSCSLAHGIWFVRANSKESRAIKDILLLCEKASGQKINLEKSELAFRKNVHRDSPVGSVCSFSWRSIRSAQAIVDDGLMWVVGTTILFESGKIDGFLMILVGRLYLLVKFYASPCQVLPPDATVKR